MAEASGGSACGYELQPSAHTLVEGATMDPRFGLLLALIEAGEWEGVRRLIGGAAATDASGAVPISIPVYARLRSDGILGLQQPEALIIPRIYQEPFGGPARSRDVCARTKHVVARVSDTEALRGQLVRLIKDVDRLAMAGAATPQLEDSLRDLRSPPDAPVDSLTLDGGGVIVGIIDDGCALAHRHFLSITGTTLESRILHFWDQSDGTTLQGAAPPEFGYGREVSKAEIDAAVQAHLGTDGVLDEDAVYDTLGYRPDDVSAHGTHVMDIAAGNGETAAGRRGIAPRADIVFVQLPRDNVEAGGPGIERHILDGVFYVLHRAWNSTPRKPAVINISFGGYGGAHDGTSMFDVMVDWILEHVTNCAIVVAAGNGFEADCHATGTLQPGQAMSLRWIVHPQDPTGNRMEIWYPGDCALTLELTSPGCDTALPVVASGTAWDLLQSGSPKRWVGRIQNSPAPGSNGDRCIQIDLGPTAEDAITSPAMAAPAPAGTWGLRLRNAGAGPATFHAWIERDRPTRRNPGRVRQSHFHREDAYPGYTIASTATGRTTISVGAYNVHTQTISRYSACGPTRATGADPGRMKPEVYAPGETDAAGRGVLSAAALSALPSRMNGTSVAAPHVAGLVALMLQWLTQRGVELPSAVIREIVMRCASTMPKLAPDARQAIDDGRPVKQIDVWSALEGCGKICLDEAIRLLAAELPPQEPQSALKGAQDGGA